MNKEVAKKWANALRSGTYKQGTYRLRKQIKEQDGIVVDMFCCLGVLCDLYSAEHDDGEWSMRKVTPTHVRILGDELTECEFVIKTESKWVRQAVHLPEVVAKWAGISSGLGTNGFSAYTLAEMNDRGETFEKIADFICGNISEES